MGTALMDFDQLVRDPCGATLATWVVGGCALADVVVRCPVTEPDGAARGRLDLALRMLPGQPVSQWCREAGSLTAVVRSWPLPARAVSLHTPDGTVSDMLLATGRPGGTADLWRFHFADDDPILDRGRRLLPT